MRQPDEDEGTGLDRQREATARLVRERGWELAAEHRDADLSAWSGVTRPEFEKLRRQVEDREVDAVVVWKLDRAFRSLSEAVTFLTLCRESGVAFISASEGIDTSSPFGPVLFALFAAMAEIESTTKSDRITAWHLERAQDGKPSGGGTRPYGF
jgi:DNA invertase Pin-like site-specific DNA recombinase